MTKELKSIDVSNYVVTDTGQVLKMTKERKQGYQPICKGNRNSVIPPNAGSHVHMKKDGYTWEDVDKSFWKGFDAARNNMEKSIEELKERCEILDKSLVTSTKNNIERQKIIDNIKIYAKTIIQDLLDNTDEYVRQRAEDFLEENK